MVFVSFSEESCLALDVLVRGAKHPKESLWPLLLDAFKDWYSTVRPRDVDFLLASEDTANDDAPRNHCQNSFVSLKAAILQWRELVNTFADPPSRLTHRNDTVPSFASLWFVKHASRQRLLQRDRNALIPACSRPFVHDDEVLISLKALRQLLRDCDPHVSLRQVLTGQWARSQSDCTARCGVSEATQVTRLLVCPVVSPPNPDRLAKNQRLDRIDVMVEQEVYNKMAPIPSRIAASVAGNGRGGSLALGGRRSGNDVNPPQDETLAVFMRDTAVALDMRLMSLAGGVVGYYVCYTRGMSTREAIAGAAIGAVAMIFVDAILLILRIRREDQQKPLRRRGGAVPPQGLPENKKTR